MKKILILCLLMPFLAKAQTDSTDIKVLDNFFNESLQNNYSYKLLEHLCNKIGGRLSGSPEATQAVQFTKKIMDTLKLDRVFLQEVMVPHWVRGKKEVGRIFTPQKGAVPVAVCALGGSVGTGIKGVLAPVIEVKNFQQLKELGAKAKGKIIFYNVPMNNSYYFTFRAYSEASVYRRTGAIEAAKVGAVGVIVRSMTTAQDDYPHTGTMSYEEGTTKIPALAISTNGADFLSKTLQKDSTAKFYMQTFCQTLPDVLSHNVVGEIKGTEYPNEIITIGGHLDSWDLGKGAHDDGAGCVQSIEILRLFKKMGIRPKRTIRIVMFMNEENGIKGGQKYAEIAKNNSKEKQVLALESDAGGFSPRAITTDAPKETLQKYQQWNTLLENYGVKIIKGSGGADISPLKSQGTILCSLSPDSQRYFDYHHTEIDTIDKVNPRELALGASVMASFIYLIDKYGW